MSAHWQQRLIEQQELRRKQMLWRTPVELSSAQGTRIQLTTGETLLNFCSNDYLGLATNPELVAELQASAKQWGTGTGASHLICGHQRAHTELEEALAEFVGAEKAIVFSTGYMANLAVTSALLTKHDVILQDKLAHASMIDAAKLSDCAFKRYPHLNYQRLQQLLQQQKQRISGLPLISTESVFSMDGDLADLSQLACIANQSDSLLLVDEAHSFGVMGPTLSLSNGGTTESLYKGAGALASVNLKPSDNRILLGTFGKALGSAGAFIAADRLIIDQIIQQGRSYIYTTASPAIQAKVTLKSLDLIRRTPCINNLNNNIAYFKTKAKQSGLTFMESNSAIQPLLVGSSNASILLSQHLRASGILATPIRPPTVANNSCRIRFTLSANHCKKDIDHLFFALAKYTEQQP